MWRAVTNFGKVFQSASQLFDRLAQGALALMVALSVANVLMRFFGRSILGTFEVVAFLTALLISFALANCGIQKGHVAIDFFIERSSRRTQLIVDSVIDIVSIGLLVIAGWRCAIYATSMYYSGELSPTLHFPFYPFIYGLAVGLLMLCLAHTVDFFRRLAKGG